MIQLKTFILKIRDALRGMVNGYRWGGVVNVNVSKIDYGQAFTADDVILVSGGTKGIGLSMAKKFLQEGSTVIITGRSQQSLDQVATELNSQRLYVKALDISDAALMEEKVEEIEKMVGKGITALVNNAGIYAVTHFPDCTEEDAMKVFSTNACGTLMLSQVMVKRWTKRTSEKPCKIINISSQGGFVGANNAYRMTKWGIRGLTEYMGRTLADKNIIVNGIAPGIVMTDMQPELKKQGDNYFTRLNPIHRIALPDEVAELATFLLTDAANTIVGQTICCDGGYSLK